MPTNGTSAHTAWRKKLQKRGKRLMPDLTNELAPFSRRTFESIASPLRYPKIPNEQQLPNWAYKKLVTKTFRSKPLRKLSAYLNDVAQLNNASIGFEASCNLLWFSDLLLSAYGMHAPFYLLPKSYPMRHMTRQHALENVLYISDRPRHLGAEFNWEDRSTWPKETTRMERLGFSFELPPRRKFGFLTTTTYPAEVRALWEATRSARTMDLLDGRDAKHIEAMRQHVWGFDPRYNPYRARNTGTGAAVKRPRT